MEETPGVVVCLRVEPFIAIVIVKVKAVEAGTITRFDSPIKDFLRDSLTARYEAFWHGSMSTSMRVSM